MKIILEAIFLFATCMIMISHTEDELPLKSFTKNKDFTFKINKNAFEIIKNRNSSKKINPLTKTKVKQRTKDIEVATIKDIDVN
ncbi:hypothetical protein [uncultured Polaribacter sp.]|uniref:hypothetical protein n=1 Tax=uncultured Polaribacter sp. TaxID=174711 RepID=UPI002604EEC7|nr:hypothetical protein [uncultured Polaribacter sp.]